MFRSCADFQRRIPVQALLVWRLSPNNCLAAELQPRRTTKEVYRKQKLNARNSSEGSLQNTTFSSRSVPARHKAVRSPVKIVTMGNIFGTHAFALCAFLVLSRCIESRIKRTPTDVWKADCFPVSTLSRTERKQFGADNSSKDIFLLLGIVLLLWV